MKTETVNNEKTDDLCEYVSGWGAAFVNVVVTFPMNKVMFRQMLHGVETHHALQQLRHEGFKHLYRGCLPPLIQKTITVSIMFGTYNGYKRFLEHECHISNQTFNMSVASILAGSTEAILTPFERVQVLLQDTQHHTRFQNTFHAFKELKPFGIKEYYRGLVPILLRNGPSTLMFFSLRGQIRDALPVNSNVFWQKFLGDFISGSLVGAFISTVFYPINVVKTIMQVQYGTPFLSLAEAFRLTYEERGRSMRKMFYGVHINYTRALVSWGIINASYEFFRTVYIKHVGLSSKSLNVQRTHL